MTLNLFYTGGITMAKQASLKELIADTLKYPIHTQEYKDTVKNIAKEVKSKYKGQYIMAIESEYLRRTLPYPAALFTQERSYPITNRGLIRHNPDEHEMKSRSTQFDFSDLNLKSSMVQTDDSSVGYFDRAKIEHDLRYKQIIANGYITDGNRIVSLVCGGKSECPNKFSMIGGHVDYTAERAFVDDGFGIIEYNMQKELEEEVRINWKDTTRTDSPKDYFQFELKGIASHDEDYYGLRNIVFIYEISLKRNSNLTLSDFIITSNEKEKHSVVEQSIQGLNSIPKDDCHGYTGVVFDYIQSTYLI